MKAGSVTYGSILLLLLSVALPRHASGQVEPQLVNVEARLENVLVLNVEPDIYCEFGVKKINDNLYQITSQPDDILFSVESTDSWNLSVTAADTCFRGIGDSTRTVPLEFVGMYIENIGTNWDNGLFSNIVNITKDTAVYLTPDRTLLLENGKLDNVGSSSHNAFILRWNFFFENDGLRFKRFPGREIMDDNYSVGVFITLSENSPE